MKAWGGMYWNAPTHTVSRIIYESMGWDKEYSYRIPCQIMRIPMPDDTVQDILIFDLDNYIGRAVNKKDEIIIARKQAEMQAVQNEDAKCFYYPPEDDDEPQELMEIAEQVQREFENRQVRFQKKGDGTNARSNQNPRKASPCDLCSAGKHCKTQGCGICESINRF